LSFLSRSIFVGRLGFVYASMNLRRGEEARFHRLRRVSWRSPAARPFPCNLFPLSALSYRVRWHPQTKSARTQHAICLVPPALTQEFPTLPSFVARPLNDVAGTVADHGARWREPCGVLFPRPECGGRGCGGCGGRGGGG